MVFYVFSPQVLLSRFGLVLVKIEFRPATVLTVLFGFLVDEIRPVEVPLVTELVFGLGLFRVVFLLRGESPVFGVTVAMEIAVVLRRLAISFIPQVWIKYLLRVVALELVVLIVFLEQAVAI